MVTKPKCAWEAYTSKMEPKHPVEDLPITHIDQRISQICWNWKVATLGPYASDFSKEWVHPQNAE